MPLGPSLGQCCGGSVTLALDHVDHIPLPAKTPLFIWGGGHVGRAIAQVLGGAETFDVHLVDTMAERTTAPLPDRVETVIVADMTLLARSSSRRRTKPCRW